MNDDRSVGLLDLDDFRDRADVLLGDEAHRLRSDYVDAFVDTEHPYFHEYIAEMRDGLYFGYLWDILIGATLIPEDELGTLVPSNASVFAMWDLHGPDRIFIPDYWKFPVDAVLRLQYGTLMQGLHHLPEDLYIFDEDLRWTIVLTHEYLDGADRFVKAVIQGLSALKSGS